MKHVLDASAILAYLREEEGAQRVAQIIRFSGAVTSSVNLAEVLAKSADIGEKPDHVFQHLQNNLMSQGILDVYPFDAILALRSAQLRAQTRSLGLSLADRVCLAIGKLHKLPVVTTDRSWKKLSIGVKIEVIR